MCDHASCDHASIAVISSITMMHCFANCFFDVVMVICVRAVIYVCAVVFLFEASRDDG